MALQAIGAAEQECRSPPAGLRHLCRDPRRPNTEHRRDAHIGPSRPTARNGRPRLEAAAPHAAAVCTPRSVRRSAEERDQDHVADTHPHPGLEDVAGRRHRPPNPRHQTHRHPRRREADKQRRNHGRQPRTGERDAHRTSGAGCRMDQDCSRRVPYRGCASRGVQVHNVRPPAVQPRRGCRLGRRRAAG